GTMTGRQHPECREQTASGGQAGAHFGISVLKVELHRPRDIGDVATGADEPGGVGVRCVVHPLCVFMLGSKAKLSTDNRHISRLIPLKLMIAEIRAAAPVPPVAGRPFAAVEGCSVEFV